MRRYLTAAALFSCLCAFVGCRHVAGVCDCVPDPSPNYWGCPGWSSGCAGCGAPGQPTPPPPAAPAVQPEAIKVMPKADDTAK